MTKVWIVTITAEFNVSVENAIDEADAIKQAKKNFHNADIDDGYITAAAIDEVYEETESYSDE